MAGEFLQIFLLHVSLTYDARMIVLASQNLLEIMFFYNISKIEDHPPILVLYASIFLKHAHELLLMSLLHACLLCLNA